MFLYSGVVSQLGIEVNEPYSDEIKPSSIKNITSTKGT